MVVSIYMKPSQNDPCTVPILLPFKCSILYSLDKLSDNLSNDDCYIFVVSSCLFTSQIADILLTNAYLRKASNPNPLSNARLTLRYRELYSPITWNLKQST